MFEILSYNEKKIICFQNEETLFDIEQKIPANISYYIISPNKKTYYSEFVSGKTNNFLCVENSTKGLDLNVEKWIFYGIHQSALHKLIRTGRENLFFFKN